MANLRKSKELQVHIVEPHNDAVPPIHRAVASRLLPFTSAAMVHLDSHPDLLLPVHMPADTVFKPAELYDSLSIENWLLPLVFAKHFDHVVWVKPPWATQIPVSRRQFLVGRCSQSGTIRVTSKENYFLTDGLFRSACELTDPSVLTLQVEEALPQGWAELDTSYSSAKPTSESARDSDTSQQEPITGTWIQRIADSVKDKPYVLDIDLDFFSTANPFRDLLGLEEEAALRRLYHYVAPSDLSDESVGSFTRSREDQLDMLEGIFTELEEERLKMTTGLGRKPSQGLQLTGDDGPLEAVLNDARKQGLDEERVQDLKLLCQTVIHQSLSTQRSLAPTPCPPQNHYLSPSSVSSNWTHPLHTHPQSNQPTPCDPCPLSDQDAVSSPLISSNSSSLSSPFVVRNASASSELQDQNNSSAQSNLPPSDQLGHSDPLCPPRQSTANGLSCSPASIEPSLLSHLASSPTPPPSQPLAATDLRDASSPTDDPGHVSASTHPATLPPPPQPSSTTSTEAPSLATPTPSAAATEPLTFLQLHDFGCTLDDTELPHHLSTPAQVAALRSEVRAMLEALPRPALVTIARSSDDGYCPKPDVDHFERHTLKMLKEVFGTLQITKHYES